MGPGERKGFCFFIAVRYIHHGRASVHLRGRRRPRGGPSIFRTSVFSVIQTVHAVRVSERERAQAGGRGKRGEDQPLGHQKGGIVQGKESAASCCNVAEMLEDAR